MYACMYCIIFICGAYKLDVMYGHNDDDVTADRNSWMNCDSYLIMTKGKLCLDL